MRILRAVLTDRFAWLAFAVGMVINIIMAFTQPRWWGVVEGVGITVAVYFVLFWLFTESKRK